MYLLPANNLDHASILAKNRRFRQMSARFDGLGKWSLERDISLRMSLDDQGLSPDLVIVRPSCRDLTDWDLDRPIRGRRLRHGTLNDVLGPEDDYG